MPSRSGKGVENKGQVLSAIISGVFLIASAAISGIFLIESNRIKEQSAATATAIARIGAPPSGQTPTPSAYIEITQPKNPGIVGRDAEIKGMISNAPKSAVVWIFTGQYLAGETRPRFWVQRGGPIIPLTDGTWTGNAYFADSDIGKDFEITAVVADPSITPYLQRYILSADKGTAIPFLDIPPFKAFSAMHTITVTRR